MLLVDDDDEGLRFRHRGFSSLLETSLKGSPVLEFRLGIFLMLLEKALVKPPALLAVHAEVGV